MRFGVARKYGNDIAQFVRGLIENGILAYEMGFAYGIPEEIPRDALEISKKHDFVLSCHLPFWINLGKQREKNVEYLTKGLRIAEQLGSVAVFHLGFYGDKNWNEIKNYAENAIEQSLEIVNAQRGMLGIETTGKQRAIGTLEEVLELVVSINNDRVIPVIDWSHVYARNNGVYPRKHKDFIQILEKFERELGYRPFYFHAGGVEYKNGNEIRHVSAKKMDYIPQLISALRELGYNDCTLIVESPDSINDAIWLQRIWEGDTQ